MMRIVLLMFLLMSGAAAWGQSSIVARMENLRSDKGVCRVCLFNKAEAFRGKEGSPLQCRAVPVMKGSAEVVFDNLPAGSYALFAFHDANNNGTFDMNFLGIPKEGYGASRNKLPFAAAPTFDANKLQLPAGSVLRITMHFRNL